MSERNHEGYPADEVLYELSNRSLAEPPSEESTMMVSADLIYDITQELLSRRTRDLTGDELVALNGLRAYLADEAFCDSPTSGWRHEAILALGRLLPGGKP